MFSPEREPIATGTPDAIVADRVDHTLATGYERPWHLPAEWPSLVDEMVTNTYRDFAKTVSEYYTWSPELIATLKFSSEAQRRDFSEYYQRVYNVWYQ